MHGTNDKARKVFLARCESKFVTGADVVYDDMLREHMKKRTTDLVLSGI